MKVLFLSLTVGVGHNMVAKVISDQLNENGVETKIIKMFDDFKFENWVFTKLNFKLGKIFPKTYTAVYNSMRKKDKGYSKHTIKKPANFLLKEINDFKPDVIVCTHVIGQLFVDEYKKMFEVTPKVYFIITDYEVPPCIKPFGVNDYIILPNEAFMQPLFKKGYTTDNLLPYGIPINSKFNIKLNKAELLNEFGLQKDKLTILIMTGGAGIGKTHKIIKSLLKEKDDFQLIIVNGRNVKSFDKIEKLKSTTNKHVLNIGFTKDVDKLMQISDVLVSKTGGLTVNEALNKSLVICSDAFLQEPEQSNFNFFKSYGAILEYRKIKDIYYVIKKANLEQIRKNMQTLQKSNALIDITNHILNN